MGPGGYILISTFALLVASGELLKLSVLLTFIMAPFVT